MSITSQEASPRWAGQHLWAGGTATERLSPECDGWAHTTSVVCLGPHAHGPACTGPSLSKGAATWQTAVFSVAGDDSAVKPE